VYGENRFLLVSIGYRIRVCAVQMFPLIGLLPAMLGRSDTDCTPFSPRGRSSPPTSIRLSDRMRLCHLQNLNRKIPHT